MKVEVRTDNSVKITGYVNAVERESKPVATPKGMVNELVESGVFHRALDAADDIPMTVDHIPTEIVARTADNTLHLKEDNIGLWAEAVVTEERVVRAAKEGKLKGWSFGMTNVLDAVEERTEKLPLRRIKRMALDHVTLVIDKIPAYSATSVELRAGTEEYLETRTFDSTVEVSATKNVDYSKYEERIKKAKGK